MQPLQMRKAQAFWMRSSSMRLCCPRLRGWRQDWHLPLAWRRLVPGMPSARWGLQQVPDQRPLVAAEDLEWVVRPCLLYTSRCV